MQHLLKPKRLTCFPPNKELHLRFYIVEVGHFLQLSRRGSGDKPMSCKPGVAGSIPGFSIKPLSVEPSEVPVIKYIE